jgi:hypothetical protein
VQPHYFKYFYSYIRFCDQSDGRIHRTTRKLERPESWKDGKAGMTEKAGTTKKAGMIAALIYRRKDEFAVLE